MPCSVAKYKYLSTTTRRSSERLKTRCRAQPPPPSQSQSPSPSRPFERVDCPGERGGTVGGVDTCGVPGGVGARDPGVGVTRGHGHNSSAYTARARAQARPGTAMGGGVMGRNGRAVPSYAKQPFASSTV